jgi:hypothetical protein
MRLLGYALSLALGLAAGVAAIAVHQTLPGLLLGAVAAVFTIWTLRLWLPRAATVFAAGWLVPLVAAVAGRREGDYAVASDLQGWLLIATGLVVLITGIAWGRPFRGPHDSAIRGAAA